MEKLQQSASKKIDENIESIRIIDTEKTLANLGLVDLKNSERQSSKKVTSILNRN